MALYSVQPKELSGDTASLYFSSSPRAKALARAHAQQIPGQAGASKAKEGGGRAHPAKDLPPIWQGVVPVRPGQDTSGPKPWRPAAGSPVPRATSPPPGPPGSAAERLRSAEVENTSLRGL
jgi:hypothetical protein